MNISYRQGVNQNCLIMEGGIGSEYEGFALRMILGNHLPGFLHASLEQIDDQRRLVYDISSLYTLNSVLEMRNLDMTDLIKIVDALEIALNVTQEHLLDAEMIVLDPDYIFTGPDENIYFCLYPFKDTQFAVWREKLADMIISGIDYRDLELVQKAYQLNTAINAENFDPAEMRGILENIPERHTGDNVLVKNVFSPAEDRENTDEDRYAERYITQDSYISRSLPEKTYGPVRKIPGTEKLHNKKPGSRKEGIMDRIREYIKDWGLI